MIITSNTLIGTLLFFIIALVGIFIFISISAKYDILYESEAIEASEQMLYEVVGDSSMVKINSIETVELVDTIIKSKFLPEIKINGWKVKIDYSVTNQLGNIDRSEFRCTLSKNKNMWIKCVVIGPIIE